MRNILVVAYSILLGLFLTVGVNAQTIKNPGVLVHAADDEATTLDPAQVEAGEVEKQLFSKYMTDYWNLGHLDLNLFLVWQRQCLQ